MSFFCIQTLPFNMSGITSSVWYAKSDPALTRSWSGPCHAEAMITNMEIRESGVPEDRIAALEKKTGEMEELLKGLVAEMLDFKAFTKTLAREGYREPAVQETVPAAPAASPAAAAQEEGRTVIRQHKSPAPEVAAEPEMVRIMQPDGTMKMEVRRGESKPRDGAKGSGRRG